MDISIGKAISDSIVKASLNRIDNKLKNCKEDASISIAQAKRMSDVLGINVHWRPSAKKIIAILVAAAILALAGCGIIYRNEIREFIVNVFDKYFDVHFENNSHLNQENIKYEFEYIPGGFELNKALSEEDYFLYENSKKEKIELYIYRLDTTISKFDTEYEKYHKFLELGNVKVLQYISENKVDYLWNDGYKTLVLRTNSDLTENEAKMIILNISRSE